MIKGAESFYLIPKSDLGSGKRVGVLLFHGWTSSPRELRELGEFLAEAGYYVYAPLLPGHGTVPEDMMKFGYEEWKEAAELFYEDFKKGVDLVFAGGFSLGGDLALILASKNPEIKGVFTIGTPVFLRFHFLKIFLPILKIVYPWVNKIYREGLAEILAKNKNHYWSFFTKSVEDAVITIDNTRKILKDIKSPALIMQSSKDRMVWQSNARYLVLKLGTSSDNKKLLWIRDSEHEIISDRHKGEAFGKISGFIEGNK